MLLIYQIKAKDSEMTAYLLCLENISKDFLVNAMRKMGLNRYVYDFTADYFKYWCCCYSGCSQIFNE